MGQWLICLSRNKYMLLEYMDYDDELERIIRELSRKYRINRIRTTDGVGRLKTYQELDYSIQWFENKYDVPYSQRLAVKKVSLCREYVY